MGAFDLFGRRPTVSSQSNLFGDSGYAGIFRRLERDFGPITGAIRSIPAEISKPPKVKKPGVLQPVKQPTVAVPHDPDPLFAQEVDVSIHKSIIKAVKTGVTGRIEQAINPTKSPIAAVAAVGARVLPAIGRVIGSRTASAAATGLAVGSLFNAGGGNGACPSGWHLNKQDGVGGPRGTYCVRNRRMNVGNARAARRSVRRLKGARKLLRDIEKMMPTKTTRRRAPQHHHHPAAGG